MEPVDKDIDKAWKHVIWLIREQMWAISYRYESHGYDTRVQCGIDVRSQLREDLGGE